MAMDRYSPLNPSALYMIQRRQRVIRSILAAAFPHGLDQVSLLEIGCGNGQWLVELQSFRFLVGNLAGIDLNPIRAAEAETRLPGADVRIGNAASLPWPDQAFDVVFQSTVFTSVPEEEEKHKIAAEMKRVTKKGGFILWYDFIYNNPANPAVRGVGRREIRTLFAPWTGEFTTVTLAPPLCRPLVTICWTAAELLETCCPFLRTHLLAKITPPV